MADWINILLRSFVSIFILFIFVKALGKKRLNQLNVFDYISNFVLAGLIAITILDTQIHFLTGVAAIFIWFLIPYVASVLSLKSKKIRNIVQGKSTVIIKEGKVMEDNLKKERLATDDLLFHLREQKIFRVADVEFALLEPTGNISIMPKAEQQPITKKDLGQSLPSQSEIHTVIMDGQLLLEPLSELGRNPDWIKTELEKMNLTVENVFLGQLDDDGQLSVDIYDDKLTVPTPTEKPLLLATLKKAHADLELFALATENEQSKQLYERNALKMEQAIHKLSPYLKE